MKKPTPNNYSLFNQDILYNISNTWGVIEFQHDIDRRVHGGTTMYHLGQSTYHAAVNFFTKISPISIMNSLGSIFGVWIIWLSCYAKDMQEKRSILGMSYFFLLFIGFNIQPHSFLEGYYRDFYCEPITLFFSVTLLVPFLFHLCSEEKNKNFLITLIYGLALCMSKATFVPTIPIVLGFFLLKNFIEDKSLQKLARDLTLLAIGIVAVKLTMYPSGTSNVVDLFIKPIQFSSFNSFQQSSIYNFNVVVQNLIKHFVSIYQSDLILKIGLLIILIFSIETVVSKKAKKLIIPAIITAFALSHLLLISVIDFKLDYVYGLWYFRFIMLFVVAYSLNETRYRYAKVVSMGLGVCIVIIGLLGFIEKHDFTKSNPWKSYIYQDQTHMIDASIDHSEWEAMNWIRNNLKEDVLILSDRQDIRHSSNTITLSRFFAYSALSGKRFFMEGDDFTSGQTTIRKKRKTDIERIYNTENLELIDFAKSHKIDYAIFSKRFRNFNKSLEDHIIYENSSIVIIKI